MSTRNNRAWAVGLAILLGGCGSSPKTTTEPVQTKPTPPAAGDTAATPAAPELPSAAEVLDRYVEVTGGKAAYEKLHSSVMTGKMSMPSMNIAGTVEAYMAAPRKMYFKASIPGIGEQERGTDGEVAWEKATMTGNRVLEGEEKAEFMREATFNSDILWRELYPKAEVVGTEDIGGKPTYKLVLTSPEGTTQTRYYDQATGYLVQTTQDAVTNMGTIPVVAEVSDYRKAGDLTLPFKNVSKMMGMEQVLTIDKVEFNVDIPADRFAVPADIQALLGGGAAKAPAKTPTPTKGSK